jgi:general secretion pathway protein H
MPISATGTSSSVRPRRSTALRRASGFTLLEVLVVIVIIGIIATMAVVSIRVLGGDHEMDQEARRLRAVLSQAREDAMLEGRDVGFRVDTTGYDFLRYDTRTEQWQVVVDDPLLRERTLPDGLEASLYMESREVRLPARSTDDEQAPATPQVVVLASGDLVPFEVRLARAGTDETRRIEGRIEGDIEIVTDDDRYRR